MEEGLDYIHTPYKAIMSSFLPDATLLGLINWPPVGGIPAHPSPRQNPSFAQQHCSGPAPSTCCPISRPLANKGFALSSGPAYPGATAAGSVPRAHNTLGAHKNVSIRFKIRGKYNDLFRGRKCFSV